MGSFTILFIAFVVNIYNNFFKNLNSSLCFTDADDAECIFGGVFFLTWVGFFLVSMNL